MLGDLPVNLVVGVAAFECPNVLGQSRLVGFSGCVMLALWLVYLCLNVVSVELM